MRERDVGEGGEGIIKIIKGGLCLSYRDKCVLSLKFLSCCELLLVELGADPILLVC